MADRKPRYRVEVLHGPVRSFVQAHMGPFQWNLGQFDERRDAVIFSNGFVSAMTCIQDMSQRVASSLAVLIEEHDVFPVITNAEDGDFIEPKRHRGASSASMRAGGDRRLSSRRASS